MANFPDLVTTDIGIIAFWNAKDHRVVAGVGDVNPTDCIPVFDSYNVYDNGIEGYKALGSGRYFHARVKSDGWMVAWIDRTNTFAYPTKTESDFGESANKGYYDILYNWFVFTANISSAQTTLSYLISLLYNALSNKVDFSYANADVGHYCYEYPGADVLTLTDLRAPKFTIKTGDVQYTTGTTLYYAAVAAAVGSDNINSSLVKFANNLLATTTSHMVYRYGTADILAENWMPNPLTDYPLYCQYNGDQNDRGAHGSILILWS